MIAIIAITIIMIYLVLIGSLTYGFDKVETLSLQDLKAKTKFSVVVPFRNEAKHLSKLLDSILSLNYPKDLFEVIFVDDDSSDESAEIIQNALDSSAEHRAFQSLVRLPALPSRQAGGQAGRSGNRSTSDQTHSMKIIKNKRISNSPKKDAISTAIAVSKHEWIITTDADCIVPKYWLDTFNEYIQTHHPNCIVAPVRYTQHHSFFNRFQTLDFLSLQGATIGGFGLKLPFLSNGANFAYQKSAFRNSNGFKGNTDIASGDDIFLLEKFKQSDAKKVAYLKSDKAIVITNPVHDMGQLIQQRLRWASKTSHNPNGFSKIAGLVVFLGNLVCTALPLVLMLGLMEVKIAIALFVIKFAIDFLLLFKTARFFGQESVLLSYIASSLLYPFFSVYIASLSWFKSYRWKGRVFKK